VSLRLFVIEFVFRVDQDHNVNTDNYKVNYKQIIHTIPKFNYYYENNIP